MHVCKREFSSRSRSRRVKFLDANVSLALGFLNCLAEKSKLHRFSLTWPVFVILFIFMDFITYFNICSAQAEPHKSINSVRSSQVCHT